MERHTAPCKNCSERHYKCHSECDKYTLYKVAREKESELRQKENEKDSAYFGRCYKMVHSGVKSKIWRSPKKQ